MGRVFFMNKGKRGLEGDAETLAAERIRSGAAERAEDGVEALAEILRPENLPLGVNEETMRRWEDAGLVNAKPLGKVRRLTADEVADMRHDPSPVVGAYDGAVASAYESIPHK